MEFQLHATVVSLIIICTWQCEALVVMTFPVYPEGISLELPTSNKQAALSVTIQAGHVKGGCDTKLAVTTSGSTAALTLYYGQLKTVISNRSISASPVYYTWAAL